MVKSSEQYIGMDVSKRKLDVYMYPKRSHACFPNTERGYEQLLLWLSPHMVALVVAEATGGLEPLRAYGEALEQIFLYLSFPRRRESSIGVPMKIHTSSILLIGAGKMGSALLASWVRAGIADSSTTVVDPKPSTLPKNIRGVSSLAEVDGKFDCVVLAVKPQAMDDVMKQLAEKYADETKSVFLSIAAGKTLSYFRKFLPHSAIVRAMPNTPALIGKGISALVANERTSESQKKLAETLLSAAGEILWLQNEGQMDAVTAISGSGPAYMFLFLELLIDAGKAQGLSDAMSKKLAIQTMIGSAELANVAEETLIQLRKNVTSPGGTTEAALGVLMKNDALKSLIHKAVWQAAKRAKELA